MQVIDSDAPTDPEMIRFLREELGQVLASAGEWQFTGPIWLWRGKAKDGSPTPTAWHFLTIDGDVAAALRANSTGRAAAWGSICVKVTLGTTSWATSLFPSKALNGYMLPIKASIRKSERVAEGDVITINLNL